MKKFMFSMLALAVCFGCSQDEGSTADATDASLVINSSQRSVNQLTEVPNRDFDTSNKGMYHGIIVTQDLSLHGKIWINLGNDGNYNATVVTDQGKELAFFANHPSVDTAKERGILFKGERGSFVFDNSDLNRPIATEVIINNIPGFIQSVKDRSTQRASAVLGTYVDFNDATFTGTWDLITDGTTNPTFFDLPNLTQVCVLGPGGAMFVDEVFETFDYPCFGVMGVGPVFHAAGGSFGGINEFIAQDQTANWVGLDATYSLGQSTSVHNANPTAVNPGFHNNDFADPPVPGCYVFVNGLQGIWSWNGREGSATFVDAFAPPPPPPSEPTSVSITNVSENLLANPQHVLNTPDLSVFE